MATSDIYRAPVGTKDVLGDESRKWLSVIKKFSHQAHIYNYDLIINPTFENFEVFSRVGEDTDIVTKEMYDFYDKGQRHIALRPEGTAQVARAFAQHRPQIPFKAWYMISNFRYERPQKGRLREHHQFGIEILGVQDVSADVEVIQFANEYLTNCGLEKFTLVINSLGDTTARAAHMEKLREYFGRYESDLGSEFAQRVKKNPLRVLDTKVPQWQDMANGAPSIHDFLSKESLEDFEYLKNELDVRNIKYEVVPRMVRGLDYYNNTIFEFISHSLDAAQSTVCAGGRYNKLVAMMDGPETPGVGFSLGVERLLMACENENVSPKVRMLDIFFIDLVDSNESQKLTMTTISQLRKSGKSVDRTFSKKSMKSAMKAADRSGAQFALLLGESELARGVISVKDMRSGEQRELLVDEILQSI